LTVVETLLQCQAPPITLISKGSGIMRLLVLHSLPETAAVFQFLSVAVPILRKLIPHAPSLSAWVFCFGV
jgi:hypothetical protein